ncbi:hypothetical protein DENSPDRAFT_872875 [Dentipellis sp. KUC8613]|nr:hypothetical protein DENSPDRAFT_872875 [Dentipellis sp. KUC8613]
MSPAIQFGDSFGALFFANLLTAILWGALCVQFYVYCLIYWKKDTWMLRALIITVCLLDTTHQAFLSISIYEYLVTHWGDDVYFPLINWSIKAQSIPLYLSIFLVQMCVSPDDLQSSTRRFNDNRVLAIVSWYIEYTCSERGCGLLSSLRQPSLRSSVSLVIWTGLVFDDSTFVQLASIANLAIACDAISAYNDILIALVFAYIMQKQKSGLRKSTNMINKLIIYSLNTGLITAAFGVAALVSTAVRRDTLIFALFFFTGGRLYANSLLAIVNLRNHTRSAGEDSENFTSLSRFEAAHDFSVVISNTENAGSRAVVPLQVLYIPPPTLASITSKAGTDGAIIKDHINSPMSLDIKLSTEVPRSATDIQLKQNTIIDPCTMSKVDAYDEA